VSSTSAPAPPFAVRDGLAVALTPAAVLAVHELRYQLAFGSESGARLQGSGHGYLEFALPVFGLLLALVAGRWLVRTAARCGVAMGPRRRPLTVWASASCVLLGLYAAQELAEGRFAVGHASGLEGVFGNGGGWAVPAAIAVGGLLALLLRGATAVERAVAAARPRLRSLLPSPPRSLQPRRCSVAAPGSRVRSTRSRGPPGVLT
jgi:hypothetical protein